MPRIRLVPVTIFVATLMLTVKVGNIWTMLHDKESAIEIRPVAAQQAPQPAPAAQPAPAQGDAVASKPEEPADKASMGDKKDDPPDVSKMSYSEIRLLQELAERRDKLDKREKQINERSALLKAAEQRLVEKQDEFKKIRQEIKDLLRIKDKKDEERLNRLVGIYSNMKPKDAANIFNKLDMTVLLDVMQAMKARKVAPIIAAMNADRAREVTQQLAERQNAPQVPN